LVRRRLVVLFLFLTITLAFLGWRLGKIALIWGPDLARGAVKQRSLASPLESPRGQVLDRNLVPLTFPVRRLSLFLFPSLFQDQEGTRRLLEKELGESWLQPWSKWLERREPVVLRPDLSPGAWQRLRQLALPGVLVAEEEIRYGPDALARHLVGYVGPDGLGLAGLEKEFDHYLYRGWAPAVAALVDGRGKLISTRGYRLLPGGPLEETKDLVLTIDAKIQKVVEEVLDENGVSRGAVVVLAVKTGEILALASRPNFDQNEVARFLSEEKTAPLLNRAVEAFQPGSLFKLVLLAAGLEERQLDLRSSFYCPGFIDIGNRRFRCYQSEGHGSISLREALAQSCNVTFIQVGRKLGGTTILRYARRFGFGQKATTDLGYENVGLLPEPTGLDPAELANLSLGQGQLLVTPLQVAQFTQAVANDGVLISPHVIREVRTRRGLAIFRPQVPPGRRVMSPQTAARIREAMLAVTEEGTGQLAWLPEGGSAGKTGSAETGRSGLSHAWFTGYAPAGRPQYVVTVLVEEGGAGGTRAAPLFRQILEGIGKRSG